MSLRNETELTNTRRKLAKLEAHYQRLRTKADVNEIWRRATLASLKRHINQFKEEIDRFQARQLSPTRPS